MAKQAMASFGAKTISQTNTNNAAGGNAYSLEAKHALAQLAATGTLNGIFYTSARSQLDTLSTLINGVDDDAFLAKLAIYSRNRAYMKEMPAALLCALSTRNNVLAQKIFNRVVDNGRILRTLFNLVRSGRFGRRGLSSGLRRAFQDWINDASVSTLLSASIGSDPSLRDVLRMARPKPVNNMRRALYGWLAGAEVGKWTPATPEDLPKEVKELIRFRQSKCEQEQAAIVADLAVRWDLLAGAARGPAVWAALARRMGPQALRMNLNTLERHGVFSNSNFSWIKKIAQAIGMVETQDSMIDYVAEKLACVDDIIRSRQFPYQYFAAFMNATASQPERIKMALNQAAEIACGQVPVLPGPVVIGVDVSYSMQSPVSGYRGKGASSKMRCIDVAALFAAAMIRRNNDCVVVPFDTKAYKVDFDKSDSILKIASKLTTYGGGGTDCSVPLRFANVDSSDRKFAGVVLISDCESWVGTGRFGQTAVMSEWSKFIANQRRIDNQSSPKLVCVDVQPNTTTQAHERQDILNVGGFSDAVFKIVSSFLANDHRRFVAEVESVDL